jgi:hypothetical protein
MIDHFGMEWYQPSAMMMDNKTGRGWGGIHTLTKKKITYVLYLHAPLHTQQWPQNKKDL